MGILRENQSVHGSMKWKKLCNGILMEQRSSGDDELLQNFLEKVEKIQNS